MTVDAVLSFWFGDSLAAEADLAPHLARWFGVDPALDRHIAAAFGDLIERARHDLLDGWVATPRGRLALIVVLDQFCRNVFRGSPRAFAQDGQAVRICRAGLARGDDRQLQPVERLFFYLPLLHSERGADQALSLACFRRLAADASGAQREVFMAWRRHAWRARAVIALFGRYPHRNAALGRRSSLPERLFLARGRLGGRRRRLTA